MNLNSVLGITSTNSYGCNAGVKIDTNKYVLYPSEAITKCLYTVDLSSGTVVQSPTNFISNAYVINGAFACSNNKVAFFFAPAFSTNNIYIYDYEQNTVTPKSLSSSLSGYRVYNGWGIDNNNVLFLLKAYSSSKWDYMGYAYVYNSSDDTVTQVIATGSCNIPVKAPNNKIYCVTGASFNSNPYYNLCVYNSTNKSFDSLFTSANGVGTTFVQPYTDENNVDYYFLIPSTAGYSTCKLKVSDNSVTELTQLSGTSTVPSQSGNWYLQDTKIWQPPNADSLQTLSETISSVYTNAEKTSSIAFGTNKCIATGSVSS